MCVIIVSLVTNSRALFSRWEIILLAMEWEAYAEGGYHIFSSEDIKVCFYTVLESKLQINLLGSMNSLSASRSWYFY